MCVAQQRIELSDLRALEAKVGRRLCKWDLDRYASGLLELEFMRGKPIHQAINVLSKAVDALRAAEDMLHEVEDECK